MSRKRSVRQLLQTLLVVNTLAVLVVGVIGALAVFETTRTVDTLSTSSVYAGSTRSRPSTARSPLSCERRWWMRELRPRTR